MTVRRRYKYTCDNPHEEKQEPEKEHEKIIRAIRELSLPPTHTNSSRLHYPDVTGPFKPYIIIISDKSH